MTEKKSCKETNGTVDRRKDNLKPGILAEYQKDELTDKQVHSQTVKQTNRQASKQTNK